MDEEVGQAAHLGPVRSRDTHQLRDHVHRQPPGEVADEVEAAGVESRLEVGHRQLPDAVLHGGHPSRRETLAGDRAHAGVGRRVHGEEGHRPVRVRSEGRGVEADAVGVGVVVDVTEGGEDVGVAA